MSSSSLHSYILPLPDTSEDSMRQKSHSLSDSLNQDSSGRFSVTSPESAIKPVYDEWMDGWMDGWMEGWMDGWMD